MRTTILLAIPVIVAAGIALQAANAQKKGSRVRLLSWLVLPLTVVVALSVAPVVAGGMSEWKLGLAVGLAAAASLIVCVVPAMVARTSRARLMVASALTGVISGAAFPVLALYFVCTLTGDCL